ncbi:MAG: STAS domain-containing protein [Candidatus Riflebacteria bacterium]|nr:STAS domain-containing protein [Candidatus Riflebacteria bacterium]
MALKLKSMETSTGCFEISLEGRLDSTTYLQLDNLLNSVLTGKPRRVRYDLTGLVYMSSMGLRMFIRTASSLRACGGAMALANPQPQIKKVFEIANALPSLGVFGSVEEADRYLDGVQKREVAKQAPAQPDAGKPQKKLGF